VRSSSFRHLPQQLASAISRSSSLRDVPLSGRFLSQGQTGSCSSRYPINGRHRSSREIAGELEAAGHVTSKGTPYGAAAVKRMIA
jgi:hypothetical protein